MIWVPCTREDRSVRLQVYQFATMWQRLALPLDSAATFPHLNAKARRTVGMMALHGDESEGRMTADLLRVMDTKSFSISLIHGSHVYILPYRICATEHKAGRFGKRFGKRSNT